MSRLPQVEGNDLQLTVQHTTWQYMAIGERELGVWKRDRHLTPPMRKRARRFS